jgi:hypothetical protein
VAAGKAVVFAVMVKAVYDGPLDTKGTDVPESAAVAAFADQTEQTSAVGADDENVTVANVPPAAGDAPVVSVICPLFVWLPATAEMVGFVPAPVPAANAGVEPVSTTTVPLAAGTRATLFP